MSDYDEKRKKLMKRREEFLNRINSTKKKLEALMEEYSIIKKTEEVYKKK